MDKGKRWNRQNKKNQNVKKTGTELIFKESKMFLVAQTVENKKSQSLVQNVKIALTQND